ncbi:hypothetical protein Bbelb_235750 [Branchiostoma belcheri]|nr:hypothetical protein Bbelb_235750 [Branchiostoma belcheri]
MVDDAKRYKFNKTPRKSLKLLRIEFLRRGKLRHRLLARDLTHLPRYPARVTSLSAVLYLVIRCNRTCRKHARFTCSHLCGHAPLPVTPVRSPHLGRADTVQNHNFAGLQSGSSGGQEREEKKIKPTLFSSPRVWNGVTHPAKPGCVRVDHLVPNVTTCHQSTRQVSFPGPKLKELAYKALVRPIVEYASCVWDPHSNQDITKIEKTQRRAARFLLHRYRNTSSVSAMLEGRQYY